MIDQLYRLVIPRPIRSKIYRKVRSKVYYDVMRGIQNQDAFRNVIDFFVDLGSRHIKDLLVVVDREAMLAYLPKNTVVAELGVDEGEFSSWILSITRPSKYHLIDLWVNDEIKQKVVERFRNQVSSGTVEIIQGNSVNELEKFPNGYFDWIYIDTDHSFATTVQELEFCRVKTKKGGVFAGHDYVTGNWQKKYRYGVIKAVHQFCIKYDWKMMFLTHEGHRHLSFAIRKTDAQ